MNRRQPTTARDEREPPPERRSRIRKALDHANAAHRRRHERLEVPGASTPLIELSSDVYRGRPQFG
jgi:hypothetical protein